MATPDFILTEDVIIHKDMWDTETIPKGTFVRPINRYYLPTHIIESKENKWFQEKTEVFAYTPIGIRLIPLKSIRRVSHEIY